MSKSTVSCSSPRNGMGPGPFLPTHISSASCETYDTVNVPLPGAGSQTVPSANAGMESTAAAAPAAMARVCLAAFILVFLAVRR